MKDGYRYTIKSDSWDIGEPLTILTVRDGCGGHIEFPVWNASCYATAVAKCADIIKAIEGANLCE
jgi:hypothetical protein